MNRMEEDADVKRDYKILIVDDEVNILDVLKKSLELSGYDVDVASDPKEAINIFRIGDFSKIDFASL